MCNMAGYVGERAAAPILLRMLEREEGFEGGFASGIATLHEGRIYYRKLVGDVARLRALTDAERLPGNIGIIHSRSLGREGDAWAHPFVSRLDGEVVTAYVANGAQGFFRPQKPRLEARAEELLSLGYEMLSQKKLEKTMYPTLSDGTSVHMSDLMCQEIQYHIDRGCDAPTAMDRAFHSVPGEITGLLLNINEGSSIAYSRINMPMFVGFASHGAYLATSDIAFPDDAGEATLLRGSSSGRVYKDRFESIPYSSDPCKIARIDPEIVGKAYEIVYKLLEEGNKKYSELYTAIKECFPVADCIDSEPLTYSILSSLHKAGKLVIDRIYVPGHAEGLSAPQSRFSLIK